MSDDAAAVREQLAWFIWCISQGYVKREDRAILTNWIAENAMMHPEDAEVRHGLLAMADEVLDALTAAGYAVVEMPEGVTVAHGARLVKDVPFGDTYTAEATPAARRTSWPYCGVCGEGEDAEQCEGCAEYGCDVCIVRGLCAKCIEAGVA